jgi:hypothetical protein
LMTRSWASEVLPFYGDRARSDVLIRRLCGIVPGAKSRSTLWRPCSVPEGKAISHNEGIASLRCEHVATVSRNAQNGIFSGNGKPGDRPCSPLIINYWRRTQKI